MSQYPECDKLLAVCEERTLILDFLQWCEVHQLELRDWSRLTSNHPRSINKTFAELANDYFKLDSTKLEAERQEITKELLDDAVQSPSWERSNFKLGEVGELAVTQRDWPEDFEDSGDYECHCTSCSNSFRGYKRRVTCRLCSWGGIKK